MKFINLILNVLLKYFEHVQGSYIVKMKTNNNLVLVKLIQMCYLYINFKCISTKKYFYLHYIMGYIGTYTLLKNE